MVGVETTEIAANGFFSTFREKLPVMRQHKFAFFLLYTSLFACKNDKFIW